MEAEKIISLLGNYQKIGSAEFLEIAALKKQYPWFSVLHALEAKCLKNENKFGLNKSIKTASLFAGDREVLYDFIHDEVQLDASSTPKFEAMPKVDEPKTALVEEVVVNHKLEINPAIGQKPIASEEAKPIEHKEKEDIKPPIKVHDPLIELQSVAKPSKEGLVSKVSKIYDPLVELPKLVAKTKTKTPNKQDFFSWLDTLSDEKPEEEVKPSKLKMSAEASALLENFIKNRPSISRIRTDIERSEVSKLSTNKSGSELVTESLASLHLKQGRPENAIEIYEKLSLQNPQKFSYFAALIEKIKKENNLE